jgi:hypothetical protein
MAKEAEHNVLSREIFSGTTDVAKSRLVVEHFSYRLNFVISIKNHKFILPFVDCQEE